MKLTDEMMHVLFFIPEGKKNAVSRTELCASVGYSDRLTRKIIAQLQEEGYLICNLSGGNGYFIASDLDEMSEYYWQEHTRAISIHKKLKGFRKRLKEAGRAV